MEGGDLVNHNLQVTLVPAAGVITEFTLQAPGKYILVNYSLLRVFGKGAAAELLVEGPKKPAVFQPLDGAGAAH